ncbi:MAG: helix-turn-helix domain-containing protein [Planctomycetes bacterium]|nr:helix-turn-helix domain-containing protein [Planctomycetota bacterium]
MPATSTPEPTAPPVLLDTCETAALLRCSPKTLALDRVRRRWRVPFLKLGGRRVVYDRAAVLRWLADRNPSELVEG